MKKQLLLALILILPMQANHYRLTARFERPGFFSEFNTIMGVLHAYENSDEITGLEVDLTNGTYYDPEYNPNYWENYFERIDICKEQRGEFEDQKKFGLYYKCCVCSYFQYAISREESHTLIQKYIKPKPHIQNKVDSFCEQHFKNEYVVGVHYRGTDKNTEAQPMTYEEVCASIEPHLQEHPEAKIFVATDEQGFLEYAQERYPGRVLSISMDRATGKEAIHHAKPDNKYSIGESAVLDCLLLSRCSILFKMASNLSAASAKFNPDIPVVDLNENYFKATKRKKYDPIQSINYALYKADQYEKTGEAFTLSLLTTGNNYPQEDANWWEYHFEPLSLGENPESTVFPASITGHCAGHALYTMPKARAHYLLQKYVKLKKEIQDKIDEFKAQEFDGNFVQGVLYIKRNGTYQPSIPYSTFINYLKRRERFLPEKNKLFVCSNDQEFCNLLRENFDNVIQYTPQQLQEVKGKSFISQAITTVKHMLFKSPEPSSAQLEIERAQLINGALLAQTNEIIGSGSSILEAVAQQNPRLIIRTFDEAIEKRTE